MHRNALVPLLIAASFASPAVAASPHPGSKTQQEGPNTAAVRAARSDATVEQMMRADANKDGRVSRDELERLDGRMSRKFDAADTNRDGQLTLREFERLRVLNSGATSGESARGTTTGPDPAARR
jgi:hypothetical protein